ncbi:MAG: hypothetical protein H6816_03315 [Phycisphaerales bacterium]|nr:hypothetical protein [Phycisphaerales bacterium]
MWRRRLTTQERAEAQQLITATGQWLRNGEPARSVAEDLLGHEIRSRLVGLQRAVARGDAARVEMLTQALEACVAELYKERCRRPR